MTEACADVGLLAVQGMRGILDAYATNTFRRTDRNYISGWQVACAAYDQLLVHLADQRGRQLPHTLTVLRRWRDAERRAVEATLAEGGLPIRLPAADSPPLPQPARLRRERLAAQVVGTGTLLANVAAGCLDEAVLATFHRLADYQRPALTVGRLGVEWHPTAFDLDEDVDEVEFMVTTTRAGDRRITSGSLRPGWSGIEWDLVHASHHTLGRPVDRGFDRD